MKKLLLALLLLFSGLATAQVIGNPYDNGPNLPATCSPSGSTGGLFFKTTAPIGLNQCTAINTWTAVGSGASTFVFNGVLASIPATCTVGQLAFITNATAGQNIYECAATNTWTQQLNNGTGAAINATNGIIPVRSNATTFIDSPLTVSGGNVTNSGSETATSFIATAGAAGISQVEAAAPSGIASSDTIYADSGPHRWKMNNNNGGAVTIMSTSDSVLATQMPALTGDITSSAGTVATALSTTGASAASCGDTTHSCSLTVDVKGRITANSNNVIAGGSTSDWMNNQIIMTWLPDQGGGWSGVNFAATDINGVTGNNTVPTSTTGFSNLYITSGVINNSQGFSQSGQTWYAGGTRGLTVYARGALTVSQVEVLAGLWFTDQAALTMLPAVGTGADNPAGNYVGIYLCNTASTQCNANGSKTNFFCIMKNGTTQTVTDSTIAADSASHSFQITEDGSNNWVFKIDGSTVCGAMSMTNKPAAGTVFRLVYGIDPLAAVAKRLGIEGVEGKSTK